MTLATPTPVTLLDVTYGSVDRQGRPLGVVRTGPGQPTQTETYEYDERGNLVGTITSFVDVTEQRRANDALRESEERFRQMADGIPEVILAYRFESRPEQSVGNVALLTLGTGIGTALIHDGVLIPNSELGHLEVDPGDKRHRPQQGHHRFDGKGPQDRESATRQRQMPAQLFEARRHERGRRRAAHEQRGLRSRP